MKVLITGANGFVGHYLVSKLLEKNFFVIATGKGECRLPFLDINNFTYRSLDFTNKEQIQSIVAQTLPDVIVHAGAIGSPDFCELNKKSAFEVNVGGTENIAKAAKSINAFVVFVSTDFIFSGTKMKYHEEDEAAPVNYYGETKMLAENIIQQYCENFTIVRTILVYGKPLSGRGNILTVVKDKLLKGEHYNVFEDQMRTPTYVEDLAAAIVTIIQKKAKGIYHIGGTDLLSPYQMACKVAEYLKLDASLLIPVTRDSFTQPALRPLLTGFDISKAKRALDFMPISFEEGLRKTFS
ncbi:MAG: SDR family oxidoreductase [Bacteroidetes bacterium]|nr:SDR family oxidoreductase [Bacteroidota bacterium]